MLCGRCLCNRCVNNSSNTRVKPEEHKKRGTAYCYNCEECYKYAYDKEKQHNYNSKRKCKYYVEDTYSIENRAISMRKSMTVIKGDIEQW